jgi:hypothetical protein
MPRTYRISVAIAAIVATLVLCAVVALHAFRVVREDNPALGLIVYTYRWWKPKEIAVDSNRDGSIDAKGVFVIGATDLRDPLREYWEDVDSDGLFEIHVLFQDNAIVLLELDQNHDGVYERRICGEEAVSFFESKARPYNNRALR